MYKRQHLTCAAIPDRLFLKNFLTNLYRNGIHNLLALRGDKPQWMSDEQFDARFYDHASDLVTAVSYTPLDVYKRQAMCIISLRMFRTFFCACVL